MSVQQKPNASQDLTTYDYVLGQIIAGRQATTINLNPEVLALHEELKETDTSQPGWIAKLLNR